MRVVDELPWGRILGNVTVPQSTPSFASSGCFDPGPTTT